MYPPLDPPASKFCNTASLFPEKSGDTRAPDEEMSITAKGVPANQPDAARLGGEESREILVGMSSLRVLLIFPFKVAVRFRKLAPVQCLSGQKDVVLGDIRILVSNK